MNFYCIRNDDSRIGLQFWDVFFLSREFVVRQFSRKKNKKIRNALVLGNIARAVLHKVLNASVAICTHAEKNNG